MVAPLYLAGAMLLVMSLSCASAPPPPPSTRAEKISRIDGLRVSDGGSGGVPVILLHGLGSSLDVWRAQLDHLRETRRAVAYDQRGHGQSAWATDGTYTVDRLADDLDHLSAQLDLNKFWLVGHSFSGAVLSTYAGKHPDKLAGVVYVDAVGDLSGAPPEVKAAFEKSDEGTTPEMLQDAYGRMLGSFAKEATRREVLATAKQMDVRAFAALRRSMAQVHAAEAISRYAGPKLVIDAQSEDWPFAASHLPGVRLVRRIPGVSHWLMLDDPATFNAALDQALAQ
jgi:pimeloyl-ACP methyl ester carboxylesterase